MTPKEIEKIIKRVKKLNDKIADLILNLTILPTSNIILDKIFMSELNQIESKSERLHRTIKSLISKINREQNKNE